MASYNCKMWNINKPISSAVEVVVSSGTKEEAIVSCRSVAKEYRKTIPFAGEVIVFI